MTNIQALEIAHREFKNVVKVIRADPSAPFKSLYKNQWAIMLPEDKHAMISDFGDGSAMLRFNWHVNSGWEEKLIEY